MKPILSDLGLVTVGDERAWAVTSPDDRYRYMLGRMWDDYFDDRSLPRPLWIFGMLNPSKARIKDDPTIRKCAGFAKRGGAGGFIVVNTMAYSETHPRKLVELYKQGVNVRGEHNAAAVQWALNTNIGRRFIAAWGRIPAKLKNLAQPQMVQFLCSRPDCFGRNDDGSPKHPLMLGYDTPIVGYHEARQ